MKSTFENFLIENNQEEENYLYTQWRLTKTFVPKVHAIIAHTFPHFSLHDDTHSETILSRIETIIGQNEIRHLSITDIWLMLTAAYYHDIGMALMAKDIEEIFAKEDFGDHVKLIQKDKFHPLFSFAELFEVKKDGVYYKPDKLCGRTFDAAKLLMADFVRKSHHTRSKKAVELDDLLHLKDSPIPCRIIGYLGKICECHGMKQADVMALPKVEMGAYGDNCHPRFIACMLRIGDLLDIDNNRFSEVLLSTLSHIPEDSLNHKEKHLSIKHFFLSDKHLELDAECSDFDVYEITDHWFKMIKEEIGWQRDHWSNIAPDGLMVSLPIIDKLDIRLNDNDIFEVTGKPGFSIETTKAIELLQGAGVYKHPASCMKELLQNAVDASYISIFLESEIDGSTVDNPDKLYKACEKRPIKVSIKNEKQEDDFVYWGIVVEDRGVGMSKEDVKYLTQTGSRNPDKQKIIEKMPEFMKPSGSFGIGFQSVFLLADAVEIESWKQSTNSHLKATLYNPAGPKKGRVVLKSDNTNVGKHGTKFSLVFKAAKIPSHVTLSSADPFSSEVVGSYDFVKDDTLDYEIAKIVEEIYRFGVSSRCPVELLMEQNEPVVLRCLEKRYDYFSKDQGLQFNIYDGSQYMSRIFFRDQLVKIQSYPMVDFLAIDVNILSGEAKDLLTLSRTEIRQDYIPQLTDRIIKAITEYITRPKWKADKQLRAMASMFLQQYYTVDELKLMKLSWLDKWKDYILPDKKTSFAEIVRKSEKSVVRIVEDKRRHMVSYQGKKKNVVSLGLGGTASDRAPLYFLLNKMFEHHPYVVYTSHKVNGVIEPCFEMSDIKRPFIEYWKGWFKMYRVESFSARRLMPCNEKYAALRVKPDDHWAVTRTFPWTENVPLMICPYIIKRKYPDPAFGAGKTSLAWDDCEDGLYKMVFEHRADEKVTIEQIIEAYKVFKQDAEAYITEKK